MSLVARAFAVLAAVALYLVASWLATVAILLLATAFEFHVPGYHEPGVTAWWGWLLALAWWAGLGALAWWAAFRLPRRRRDQPS